MRRTPMVFAVAVWLCLAACAENGPERGEEAPAPGASSGALDALEIELTPCKGDGDCPAGAHCKSGRACGFDCRTDADCPAGTRCGSRGACEGGER